MLWGEVTGNRLHSAAYPRKHLFDLAMGPPPPNRPSEAHRIADLTEEEQELLDVAACLGFEFDPGLVAATGGDVQAVLLYGSHLLKASPDRHSAYEVLMARADAAAKEAEEAERAEEEAEAREREFKQARRYEADRVGRSTSRSSRSIFNRSFSDV
mgnify:CR=1 FL=1